MFWVFRNSVEKSHNYYLGVEDKNIQLTIFSFKKSNAIKIRILDYRSLVLCNLVWQ